MTEQQTANIGTEAQRVIESEAYKQAMTNLKAQIVDNWRQCPVRDSEGQLLLLQLAKLADKFEAIMTGMVQAGKLAQHQINLDSERNESATRKFFRRVA